MATGADVASMIATMQGYATAALQSANTSASTLSTAWASAPSVPTLAAVPLVNPATPQSGRQWSDYAKLPIPTLPTAPSFTPIDFAGALRLVESVVNDTTNSNSLASALSVPNGWLSTYFPAALPNGLELLLQQIANGVLVTQTQQDIMWARARSQIQRDYRRTTDEAINRWASRGFAMPGGVINNELQVAAQEYQFKSADLAGQQAIKALDIQIEAVKFGAEESVKLQIGLINGMAEMIRTYASMPASAAQFASAEAEAQYRMELAIVEYYKMTFMNAEIQLKTQMADMDAYTKNMHTAAELFGKQLATRVQAVGMATDAYAKEAASALSGLHTVVTDSQSTTY